MTAQSAWPEPEAPLVALAGPTGSGKSEASVRLAERFGGEIVNCDSVQVYRYLDIGSAKLPAGERRGVPHHLLDEVDPGENFTAGDFVRRARPVLHAIAASGRLPIVVGGTGLYLRALLEGLFPGPARDEPLRARLAAREARRPGSLHRILGRLDPAAARRIHPNDTKKAIRALEVCLLARRPLSELFSAGRDPLRGFRPLKIFLDPPREQLYRRLNLRVERMFEAGLVEEVRGILERGVAPDCKALESLGYRQALQVLRGAIDVDEAIRLTQLETRRYAKRQWTWFRREPDVLWVEGFGDDENTQSRLIRLVEAYLERFSGVVKAP